MAVTRAPKCVAKTSGLPPGGWRHPQVIYPSTLRVSQLASPNQKSAHRIHVFQSNNFNWGALGGDLTLWLSPVWMFRTTVLLCSASGFHLSSIFIHVLSSRWQPYWLYVLMHHGKINQLGRKSNILKHRLVVYINPKLARVKPIQPENYTLPTRCNSW